MPPAPAPYRLHVCEAASRSAEVRSDSLFSLQRTLDAWRTLAPVEQERARGLPARLRAAERATRR